jgi:hypothetical protein
MSADFGGFLAAPPNDRRDAFIGASLMIGVQKEPLSGVIGVEQGPLILMV